MELPDPVAWPEKAMTFMLMGGRDFFKRKLSSEDYVLQAQNCVNPRNKTTAILFVEEMTHMPQVELLTAILPQALRSLVTWKQTGLAPINDFKLLVATLKQSSWSGCLHYTTPEGDWGKMSFGTSLLQPPSRELVVRRVLRNVTPREQPEKLETPINWHVSVSSVKTVLSGRTLMEPVRKDDTAKRPHIGGEIVVTKIYKKEHLSYDQQANPGSSCGVVIYRPKHQSTNQCVTIR